VILLTHYKLSRAIRSVLDVSLRERAIHDQATSCAAIRPRTLIEVTPATVVTWRARALASLKPQTVLRRVTKSRS